MLGGGFNYDSGNDCGQSVWGAVGYFVEPYTVLACHVSAGRCLVIDNIVLHLALGTAGRRTERLGILRTVPFFEKAGAVAQSGSYSFGQRWCILLV